MPLVPAPAMLKAALLSTPDEPCVSLMMTNEMPAASPQQKAPAMPLEPGLDEHGKQKPRDRAFIQTVREWNLARQKKNQEGS